jgi:hypothetical protein
LNRAKLVEDSLPCRQRSKERSPARVAVPPTLKGLLMSGPLKKPALPAARVVR